LLTLTAGFTKHVSLTTPASLSEELDDSQDAGTTAAAAAATALRRSLTTDDAILMSQRIQPISIAR